MTCKEKDRLSPACLASFLWGFAGGLRVEESESLCKTDGAFILRSYASTSERFSMLPRMPSGRGLLADTGATREIFLQLMAQDEEPMVLVGDVDVPADDTPEFPDVDTADPPWCG